MAQYLSRSEWEHLVPERVGRERVNHDSDACGGDSLSLLVERRADGSCAAFCFRCGKSGYIPPEGYYQRPGERSSGVGLVEKDGYEFPEDATSIIPPKAKAWLGKAGIHEQTHNRPGFLWSPSRDMLYIPVEQHGISTYGQKAVGWVLRGFEPKRYLTLTDNQTGFWGLYRPSEGHSGSVVLVEDVLSAVRTSQFVDSVALLGTELKPGVLTYLLSAGYNRGIVFLDYDNPKVKTKAHSIAQRLSWMPRVDVIDVGTDPKHFPNHELEQLLTQP